MKLFCLFPVVAIFSLLTGCASTGRQDSTAAKEKDSARWASKIGPAAKW